MSKKPHNRRYSHAGSSETSGILQMAVQSYQKGDLIEAEAHARNALKIDRQSADALLILGVCAYGMKKYDQACQYYEYALKISKSPLLYNNLGAALMESGKMEEAIHAYREAITLKGDYGEAYCNLGNALRKNGDGDGAIEAYGKSLKLDPSNVMTLYNLGHSLKDGGRIGEAIEAYREAIRLSPGFADAFRSLGVALRTAGRVDEAIDTYRQAIALKPHYPEAYFNLGNVLRDKGSSDEAAVSYRQAIALKPDYAEALSNLGNLLRERGDIEEAVNACRQAITRAPGFAEAYNNLGNALKDQGRVEEAIEAYGHAVRLNPQLPEAHSNLIYSHQFLPEITLEAILRDHRRWNAVHCAAFENKHPSFQNTPDPHRKLVLGFVSGDFRTHPVGYFLITIFEALAREDVEVVCYANQKAYDGLTARFRAASSSWRDIGGLTDDEVCKMVIRDRIDILFDLTGHIENNRLGLFARKPAPLQITWAGYMATTGMDAIDYIIADPHEIPDGAERYYTEKVIRMDGSFVCYEAPNYAPPVGPLPALSKDYVTFGCFNILCKISPKVIETWRDIFFRLPRARLVLKTRELSCKRTRERYLGLLNHYGIDSSRIDLIGRTDHAQHLEYYNSIDIALDTFPFSGSTTTLESLWMGVPVVTLPGEAFAGRHSLSFLSSLGLKETIACDGSDFARIAVELAGDVPRLAHLRASLRGRFISSPLCDGQGYARRLIGELRIAWSRWCTNSIE